MEHEHERRIAPWVWVLIVLLALILVFVVWWVVAAQNPGTVVVVPGPSQPTTTPQTQPSQPAGGTQPSQPAQPSQPSQPAKPQPAAKPQQPAQPSQASQPKQPVVVQPQPPINIYVNNKQPAPQVYIVPKGQQPPSGAQNAQQVTLPGAFNYQGRTWSPSNQAVTSASTKLKEIGVSVNSKPIYAAQDAKPPYDALYLETSPGSGVFLKYD
jgi:outer membrane biosynthesis protein TonB